VKYSYFGRREVSSRMYSSSGAQPDCTSTHLTSFSKIRFDIVLPFYSQQALPSGLSNQKPCMNFFSLPFMQLIPPISPTRISTLHDERLVTTVALVEVYTFIMMNTFYRVWQKELSYLRSE